MPAAQFTFRECQNPECDLRYPVEGSSTSSERCPLCLGKTVRVAEGAAELERVRTSKPSAETLSLHALVDNVRSAWNVGSIFRSAEGYGFEHLYLCGITPTPTNARLKKTALGAEDVVGWSEHRNAVKLISSLRDRGHTIWALEHTVLSKPIDSFVINHSEQGTWVLVVGNERAGIDPEILRLAHKTVHLDMRGHKRSFNVAVAFAVAAHVIQGKVMEAQRTSADPLTHP